MIQVVGNLEGLVQRGDLASIHSEDVILTESLSAILQQADLLEPDRRGPFRADVKQFGEKIGLLHYAGDTQQQELSEKTLRLVVETFDRIKTNFPMATQVSAEEAASQYVCPAHREVSGKRTELCPKCGAALDQQARLLPAFCGAASPEKQFVRAFVRTDKPPVKGETVNAFLQLSRPDGAPVWPYDLITTHTEKIHLFIIDSSLSDYHHVHPRPTEVGGEYWFPFRPRNDGSYLAWAEVLPAPVGPQQYVPTMITAITANRSLGDLSPTTKTVVDGLTYELIFAPGALVVNRMISGRLRITQPDGTPFTKLEPLMASFSHLVAFHEDLTTVLHIHPKGLPVLGPKERGGPELEFQFYALKTGFMRLFAQVQIDGASKFAPFGIRIAR